LAATSALAREGWLIHAVLPFDQTAYELDFTAESSVSGSLEEFRHLLSKAAKVTTLDGIPGHYDAYAGLGQVLVDQCDLLIAVWDGKPSRGSGGTANVIALARKSDLPIIRIDPHSKGDAWLENLERSDHGRGELLSLLADRLKVMVAGPPDLKAAHDFFSEEVPTRTLPRLYDRVVGWLAGDQGTSGIKRFALAGGAPIAARPGEMRKEKWVAEWQVMPEALRQQVATQLGVWHGWADELARWYAAQFRQTFTAVFLLAVVAVLAAGLGTLDLPTKWGWAAHLPEVVEIACLVEMYRRVVAGRKCRFHERWMDYRSLAERLRHLTFLWPLGRTTPSVRIPDSDAVGDTGGGWVGWLLRSIVRELGLVTGRLDSEHVEMMRRFMLEAEIQPQRAFHAAASRRAALVHHPIERWAERLVLLAIILAAVRLSDIAGWLLHDLAGLQLDQVVKIEWQLAAGFTAASVTLPALAASMHGFLGTGDFEGIAIRSGAIEPRLAQLQARLRRLYQPDLNQVGEIAVDLAAAMEGELRTWQMVTQSRRAQFS
jgi:hypothetical protein